MKLLKRFTLVLVGLTGVTCSADEVVGWGLNDFGQTTTPANLSNVVAVTGGRRTSYAITDSGNVQVWGSATNLPASLTNVISISVGDFWQTVAVDSNGNLVSWDDQGSKPPTSISNVASVAVGWQGLALKKDGNIAVWINSLLPPRTSGVSAVAANLHRSFTINADGTVSTWAPYTLPPAPSDLTNIASLAGAAGHTVALRLDGTVTVWGSATEGQANIPPGLSNVVEISTGRGHVLALKSDGSVVAWGRNVEGQCDVPADLGMTGAVSAGDYHSLALRAKSDPTIARLRPVNQFLGMPVLLSVGAVSRWPLSFQWQLRGTNVPGATNSVLRLEALTRDNEGSYTVIISNAAGAVTVGQTEVRAIREAVLAWGNNEYDKCVVPHYLADVAGFSAGRNHSLAVREDGQVFAWGTNDYFKANVPAGLSNVVAVCAAPDHSMAVRADGTFALWGKEVPYVPTVTNIMAISSKGAVDVGLTSDGRFLYWDRLTYGQFPPYEFGRAAAVSVCGHTIALTAHGTANVWGYSYTGPRDELSNIVAVAAGFDTHLALKTDGTVVGWGSLTPPPGLSNVVDIASGWDHALAVRSDGSLVSWGNNSAGQTNSPPGLRLVTGISAGSQYSLAHVRADDPAIARQPVMPWLIAGQRAHLSVGAVSSRPLTYQWQRNSEPIAGATDAVFMIPSVGPNQEGEYSVIVSNETGSAISRTVPVRSSQRAVVAWRNLAVPPGWNDVRMVDSGHSFTLALRLDGSVLATGSYPGLPPSLTNVVAVSAGFDHGLALKSDGRVTAWYRNSNPLPLPESLTNIIAVSAGSGYSLGLNDKGRIIQWENWGNGKLLPGPSTVAAISAGANHCLALKSDGTIIAWDSNGYQQSDVPPGLSNVVAIAAGTGFSLALRSDGTVTAWGANDKGQCNVPADLTNAVAVAAGKDHSLALRSDGSLTAWGYNSLGQCSVPAYLGRYHVGVCAGEVISLTVTDPSDPAFVRHPLNARAFTGTPALLSAAARSLEPLNFQWHHDGSIIPGATNAFLFLPSTELSDAGTYTVVISNALGNLLSEPAVLTVVQQPPVLLSEPTNQVVSSLTGTEFRADVEGSGTMAYQWHKDGSPIPGATNEVLPLTSLRRADAGEYSLTIKNEFGSATTSNATLRVLVPQKLQAIIEPESNTLTVLFSDSDGGLLSMEDAPFFQVQVSTNLVQWGPLTNSLFGTNGHLLLWDSSTTDSPQRFYRVLEHP